MSSTSSSNNGKVMCQAVTKTGQPCHNGACGEGGYIVCRVHREGHNTKGGRVASVDTKQTTVVKQEETEIVIEKKKKKNARKTRNNKDDESSSSSSSSSSSDSDSDSDEDEKKQTVRGKGKKVKNDEDDGVSCQEVMCKLGIRDSNDYSDWVDRTRNVDNPLTRKVKSCVDKKRWCGLRSDLLDSEREVKKNVMSECERVMEKYNIESVTDLNEWLKENRPLVPILANYVEQCSMMGKYKKRT